MTEWYQSRRQIQSIEPTDRGFQYGDGLFETIAIRDGEPRQFRYHMDRLEAGCARLGLGIAGTSIESDLEAALLQTAHDSSSCIAKVIVTAGSASRGYGRSMDTPAEIYIGIFAAMPLERAAYVDGVETMLCKTRLATGSPVAGLKTLNRIEQVLANSELKATGAFEGLTLDAAGRLICGTISNVFIVGDKIIRTPSLERCGVEGTMRRLVIELLGSEERVVEVCDLSEDDLVVADEVFITNSQMGAVPVSRCGHYNWAVGDATRHVMQLLTAQGISECRQ